MTQAQPFDWENPREVPGDAEKRRDVLQARVDDWNAANPEVATPFGRENLARAAGLFPHAVGDAEQMWVDRFSEDPDLMWRFVGDVVRYVSSEEVPRGDRVSSRRQVQPQHRNLQYVHDVLHGRHSLDPFPVAVRELIGERSLRLFATRSGFGSVETLRRYLAGERPLTMECLEGMASAGRVEPFFFREYRAMWLAREMFRAMLDRPNESLRAIRMIRSAVN